MRNIFIVLFINLSLILYSQKTSENFSLVRNIKESTNMNSGKVEVIIPLFEINENNVKIKNTLQYDSRGFSPFLCPSFVGQNWELEQFGKITRVSNRIDLTTLGTLLSPNLIFYDSKSEAHNYFAKDCINAVFPPVNNMATYKKDVYENPLSRQYHVSTLTSNSFGYNHFQYQYSPDKFYFDFFGYKGYFVIDNEMRPIVYCENATLKIDFNNFNCYDIFNDISFSELRITDDKGNQYIFGGTQEYLDINYSYNQIIYNFNSADIGYGSKRSKTNYIDSWALRKVILINGQEINAYYKKGDLSVLNNYRNTGNLRSYTYNGGNFYTFESLINETENFPTNSELTNANLTVVATYRTLSESSPYIQTYNNTYTKKAILDSIKFNNTAIKYNYSNTENNLEKTNNYLKSIDVLKNNKLVKKVSLIYENLGQTNKRTFLKNIEKSDDSSIGFEYYNTDKFPDYKYSDRYTNQFGFWNGGIISSTLTQDHNENFEMFNVGLLRKITYPTKGYIEYVYEHSDYSKKSFYDRIESFGSDVKTSVPRISKIKYYDLSGNNEETTYSYLNDDNKSSGILRDVNFMLIDNYNMVYNNSIHYSTVKEERKGRGYSKYIFSDFITNPDSITIKKFLGRNVFFIPYENEYISKQNERGKILKEEIFDNNNNRIRDTSYKYKNFLKKLPNINYIGNNNKISDLYYYIETYSPTSLSLNPPLNERDIYTKYVPVLPYLPISINTKEYFPNNKVIENNKDITYLDTFYILGNGDYYWHPNPIEEKITNNIGTITKKNIYPIDLYKNNPCAGFVGCVFSDDETIVGGQYNAYDILVSNNINTPVIEILNNNGKFSLRENLFHPTKFFSSEPKTIKKIRHSTQDALTDFANFKIASSKTVEDQKFDLYDSRYNCIQVTSKSGISTTIIYGYNQTQPIAKVEGATYAQVMQAFSLSTTDVSSYLGLDIVKKSDLDIDDVSEQNLLSALETFRNNTAFKDFQITTYTYNPLIGVTSMTSPNGMKEFYKYNAQNKLEKVLDADGNILKEYKYQFKQ